MIGKCSSPQGLFEPFYLIQSNNQDNRYVVTLNDKESVRTLLLSFINSSRNHQIKIRDFDDQENPVDYSGTAKRKLLHKIIMGFDDELFNNGYFDFMIRHPKSGDYIVYDEHGLVFIYSAKDYRNILQQAGAEYKPDEKLIYQHDHWHRKESNGSQRLKELINSLCLKKE